jgi:hypothetical protein
VKNHAATVEWVAKFLWRWEESELLCGEAAEGIVSVIETRLASEGKGESLPFPEPQAYLKALENREY